MMRRSLALLATLALVAGCGERKSEEVAAEATQSAPSAPATAAAAPSQALALQPMTMADIEQYDLYGVGCVFEPEGAGKDQWTVITGDGDAHVKRGGVLVRLTAQRGARELDWLAVTRYATGSLLLAIEPGPGEARITGEESSEQRATISLRDTASGALYQAAGMLNCGA